MNYHQPVLTVDEAWDIAAFINSQPRPVYDISKDWPLVKENHLTTLLVPMQIPSQNSSVNSVHG